MLERMYSLLLLGWRKDMLFPYAGDWIRSSFMLESGCVPHNILYVLYVILQVNF